MVSDMNAESMAGLTNLGAKPCSEIFLDLPQDQNETPDDRVLFSDVVLETKVCCALYSKLKVGASASVWRVTSCVHCWVHFVTIAKMYGHLFSGRPSKVLPWS